jgi:hypothetical protein
MKCKISLLFATCLFSLQSHAFSIDDHKMITEIAFEEMKVCGLLNSQLLGEDDGKYALRKLKESNADEDNYLKNGLKKIFVFSHFYNPMRPLKPQLFRRNHADAAVEKYSDDILSVISVGEEHRYSVTNLKDLGKIIHQVQDASSAPHVLWINHAMNDGFENKVKISKSELVELKPDCSVVYLAGLRNPSEILKAAALSTMKNLEESFTFHEILPDGLEHEMSAPWSLAFFTNKHLQTQNVKFFLRGFNFLNPKLNTPDEDDEKNINWSHKELSNGEYGWLSSEIKNAVMRGDNFGNTQIFSVGGRSFKVKQDQYKSLRKNLLRDAILSTQRLILWLEAAEVNSDQLNIN